MSETKDGLKYDLYDFTKSIYIFSHMKTILVDKTVQYFEAVLLFIILLVTIILAIFVLFKILIIFVYFLAFQASIAFKNFIQLSYKSRCDISCKNSCKYFLLFVWRILKKIYTFNFYIIQNKTISLLLVIFFLINFIFNSIFLILNIMQIEMIEKDDAFINFYFLSFEFYLLMELICYMFYSVRNIFHAVLLAFGYFITLNLIIALAFLYVWKYEYLYGGFMLNEPQRILNIIIFSILMILKIYCLYKIIYFNKESK